MFQVTLPEAGGLPAQGGITDAAGLDALNKALTAGYGTDSSTFTGGTAFRIQSLDKTMKSTIQEQDDFALFNILAKQGAGATVDEWTERSGVGGFLGGTTNSELGTVNAAQGVYNRRTAEVKYLMTRCEVSFVSTLGNNMVSAKAAEAQAGALRLLSDAEYLSFDGDSLVVPTEFDGIYAQIRNGVSAGQINPANIIDLQGTPLTDIAQFNAGAAQIRALGNFGRASHYFCSIDMQADLDSSLAPAARVPLTDVKGGGIDLGSPVEGIRTSYGNVKNVPDVFIKDNNSMVPWQAVPALQGFAATNAGLNPAGVAAAAANNASSKFNAQRAGNYYYLVCGVNMQGQSTGVVSAQVAVGGSQAVTLTITPSAGGQETGYAIYRSAQNGSNAPANMRLMVRIPAAGGGQPTTYVDSCFDLPGTSKGFMLNMRPGSDNISWRQLQPMMEFQLYPTATMTVPWVQALFGYLRITKRNQNVIYKNVLPSNSNWTPFVAGVS